MNDIIIYVENENKLLLKKFFLGLMEDRRNIGVKIYVQKSIAFLYNSTEQLDLNKTLLFTMALST